MKRIPRFEVFFILAMLCACSQSGLPEDPYKDLEPAVFFAYNFGTRESYQLNAVKLLERPGVVVYGERSVRNLFDMADKIADEFERILEVICPIFGEPLDYNEDGRIALLLLDIKDGGSTDSYTAGYFYPNDMSNGSVLFPSNMRDMLYLDVVQGGPRRDDFYATIAHELQHLIRHSAALTGTKTYSDTWLDEGLSLAAEYVYYKTEGKETGILRDYYVDSFNGKDRKSKIPDGNNFFVWISDEYVLDEYATAYLFFQWLRIQADNDIKIYKDIIASITESRNGGYQAVLDAAKKRIDPSIDSWETLIRSWLLANYVQAPAKTGERGLYGYNGEFPDLNIFASNKQEIRLYPGEGAYSILEGTPFSPAEGGGLNIRYAGVTKAGTFSETEPYTGARLLTFNSNQSRTGVGELGYLTGKGDPPVSGRSSRQASGPYPPYRIDTFPASPEPGRDTGSVRE
jgi:hypothetical protein